MATKSYYTGLDYMYFTFLYQYSSICIKVIRRKNFTHTFILMYLFIILSTRSLDEIHQMRRSRSPTRHHDASRSPVDRRPRDRDNQYLSDQEGYVLYLYISIKVPVQLLKYFLSKIDEKSPHIYNSSNQVPIHILRQSFYPPLCGAFPSY